MTNVMTRAWEIARQGQSNFGGKASEYLSEALKMAWAEVNKKDYAIVTTLEGSRNHKSWVAKLTDTDARWGFVREFIREEQDDKRDKTFILGNGYYEVCNAGDREFIKVTNGEIEYLEKHEVLVA